LKIPSVWLSGGEPLTHPDICRILNVFGATKPLDYWMVTNGILLNDRVIETIMNCGLTWLSVSIDAANSETYKKIRGGDLDTVQKNIETFTCMRNRSKSRLPFLRVTFVCMADNERNTHAASSANLNIFSAISKSYDGKELLDTGTNG
jgi:MoaA/NifB/PqqE/SkfB family radical SAM enzyme